MSSHFALPAVTIAMALLAAPAIASAQQKIARNTPLPAMGNDFAPAPAEPADPNQAPPPPPPERTVTLSHVASQYGRFGIELGLRGVVVADRGFDPYSQGNVSNQLALGFSVVPLTSGRFALALSGEWNYGNRESTARSDTSSLAAHRLAFGVQGRAHLGSRFYTS